MLKPNMRYAELKDSCAISTLCRMRIREEVRGRERGPGMCPCRQCALLRGK